MRRLENQLLHAPIQELGDVELVFRGAGDFVNPSKLLELLARLAEHSQEFSFERQLIDASGKGVRGIEHLVWSGSDADSPRRSRRHGPGGLRWLATDCGARIGIERDIDCDLTQKFSV